MKIRLTFLGAAQNVTGSRFLLETDELRLLVDCGLYQERDLRDRNWDPFPVAPRTINAILLTHAHLDHCGMIPKLAKEGFQGKIYCTEPTAEISQIVMADSGHLQEEDAAFKRKRHEREKRQSPRPVEPLYTAEDAAACRELFAPVPYDTTIDIGKGVQASFINVGHILGAASIVVNVQKNGTSRRLVFSGDVGRWDRPILKDPSLIEHADYLLVESTYGDRHHETTADVKDKLADAINQTSKDGGNIVIPSFSIERSQDLLYYLNELLMEDRIPHLMTFMDSPMAIAVTKIFKKYPELYDAQTTNHVNNHNSPFHAPNVHMTQTSDQSKAINHIKGTVIIIAGSGMCTGGRIKHHLVNNIERKESTVLFVGYQAVGTLGRILVDRPKEVRILGQTRRVAAQIKKIHGFSGHADQNELMQWLSKVNPAPRQTFVIHGEAKTAAHFSNYLHEQKGWKTTVPEYRQSVVLD